ncbi:MAG TPA: archease [Candidatus Binatia bacterium]|nr:archease [Candidatus Binatia bacterium]
MGRFRVLEEIALADLALEIEGDGLDDLFATAARALAELTVDPATLDGRVERRVTLDAPALDLLLYDWLAELIFLKDRDRDIFPEVEVRVTAGTPSRLEATLRGGRIERGATVLHVDPKAPTFHRLAVEPLPAGRWRATVVIDV